MILIHKRIVNVKHAHDYVFALSVAYIFIRPAFKHSDSAGT